MSVYLLRLLVAGLAAVNVGAMLTIATLYTRAAIRNGFRATGNILVRHVIEVSLGVGFLVAGTGWGVYSTLYSATPPTGPSLTRLVMFCIAMVLLLASLSDVGRHTRHRTRRWSSAEWTADPPDDPPTAGRHARH